MISGNMVAAKLVSRHRLLCGSISCISSNTNTMVIPQTWLSEPYNNKSNACR